MKTLVDEPLKVANKIAINIVRVVLLFYIRAVQKDIGDAYLPEFGGKDHKAI